MYSKGLFKNSLAAIGIGFLAMTPCATPAQLAKAVAATPRITQPVREDQLVPLKNNVYPQLQRGVDLGQAAGSMPTGHIMLLLQRSAGQQEALTEYLADLQSASSPHYHQWLTPAQYGVLYGPAQSDVEAVANWLGSHGFQVEKTSRGLNLIVFSGTIADLQSTFHTSVHEFSLNGEHHFANVSDPEIPAALAPAVVGVTQLNDFYPKPTVKLGPTGKYDATTHSIKPDFTLFSGITPYLFVDPADAATIYDTPNAALNANYTGTTYDGTGVNIGVVGDSNINISDIANYRVAFLGETVANANVPTVIVDGDDPGINGDETEALLDTEVSGGLAPKAKVYLYTSSNTDLTPGIFIAINRAVEDNLVSILNISFGGCEANVGTSGNAVISELFEQAAAQGISVTVSSGDSGSAVCDADTSTQAQYGLAVNAYASTPYDVAVGGTDYDILATDFTTYVQDQSGGQDTSGTPPYYRTALKYIPEEPWNDSTSVNTTISQNVALLQNNVTDIVAGGGGASILYAKPAFQSALTPADGARDLPDVSFLAGNGLYGAVWVLCGDGGSGGPDCATSGGQFTASSTFTGVGGTSAAAPAFAGILALIEQATGSRLGQANYVLYQLAKSNYATVFHDVTTGNNSVVCTPGSSDCGSNGFMTGFNATSGYDEASGLGSLDATALLNNWNKVALASSATTFNIDGSTAPVNVTHGAGLTFNVGVTPATVAGFVGIIDNANEVSGGPKNNGQIAIPLAGGLGSISYNGLPGGTYTVYARYGGDSADAASSSTPAIDVTIAPESSTTALSVNPYSAVGGSPLTGSLTSIPYGSYIFADAQIYGTAEGENATQGLATGTVTFTDNGTTLGTVAVSSANVASYPTQNSSFYVFPLGPHSVTAAYPGDVSYKSSASTPVAFTVVKGATSISIGSSYTTIPSSVSPTITIDVDTSGIGINPTGSVVLTSNSNTLATLTNLQSAIGSNGLIASFGAGSIAGNQLAVGPNTVTATYSGDSNYLGSSGTIVITVTPAPGITLTNGGNITIAPGATTGNTSTIRVTPSNGFTGAVALSCMVTTSPAGAHDPVTCGIAPASVNISGASLSTAVMTVSTTAPATAMVARPLKEFLLSNGGVFALVVFFGVPSRRRKLHKLLALMAMSVFITAVGCGGAAGGGVSTNPGTTSGTYAVTVTASSTGVTSQTTIVSVTVN
jgi:trimeric autotransporter adhesin